MTRIAVIGAGLAGLVVSSELSRSSEVTVFEKSRGVGGRIATRYAGDYEFDHGAQFFTARSQRFQSFLQPLVERGVVSSWQARFAEFERSNIVGTRRWDIEYPHYVGAPRMNAIGKFLARSIDVRLRTTVALIERTDKGWLLFDSEALELGLFDWVIFTAPSAQTAALSPQTSCIRKAGQAARMRACGALMLAFEQPVDLPFDAALVRDADISWISVNSSKPSRSSPFTLVVHSTNAWADAHIDEDNDLSLGHMLDQASLVTGKDLRSAAHCQLHWWRYANIARQTGPTFLMEEDDRLAACGDWCVYGRIEAAFTSASDLAASLIETV